jgi:hypothetical protein
MTDMVGCPICDKVPPHAHPNEEVEFRLDGYYSLDISMPPPTWRHRLYWFLRRIIDRIHP